MPTFRAPMRSRRDDVVPFAAVERALAEGLCGMGGRLRSVPATLAEALEAVETELDERIAGRIARFAAAPDESEVWTRDADGWYWCGRLAGPWRYDSAPAAETVDLVHVRDCAWGDAPVAESDAPTPVVETFARGGRNWQRIRTMD